MSGSRDDDNNKDAGKPQGASLFRRRIGDTDPQEASKRAGAPTSWSGERRRLSDRPDIQSERLSTSFDPVGGSRTSGPSLSSRSQQPADPPSTRRPIASWTPKTEDGDVPGYGRDSGPVRSDGTGNGDERIDALKAFSDAVHSAAGKPTPDRPDSKNTAASQTDHNSASGKAPDSERADEGQPAPGFKATPVKTTPVFKTSSGGTISQRPDTAVSAPAGTKATADRPVQSPNLEVKAPEAPLLMTEKPVAPGSPSENKPTQAKPEVGAPRSPESRVAPHERDSGLSPEKRSADVALHPTVMGRRSEPVKGEERPRPAIVRGGPGLSIHSLGKQYKKRPVLRDVSLAVQRGEAVGLLGPNGAGKTTCFYIVTGLIAADYGSIELDGHDITDLPMYRRARLGIGYLPQEASIFRGLTVEENIRAVLELIEKKRDEREQMLESLLAEFSISHLRRTPAIALSGGERRRLEIARALATQPHFILLDEPLAGIDPIAVRDIRELVKHLKDRGIGVLITDHNVRETLDVVDRAYILHDGRVLMEGTPDEIVANSEVRRVYLGDRFSL